MQTSSVTLEGKLSSSSGQAKDVITQKEQELEGFRSRVIELEREMKKKDERLSQLEAKVVELSTEVADKDYEIEFYSNQIEEL
jgi:predicted  nucleic acid-binding Zn-ribbon protein